MKQKRYTIGIDYGSLSARAVLLDIEEGKILPYDSVYVYPHGILSELDGKPLPALYAIQNPQDYMDGLAFILRDVMEKNGVTGDTVEGIGIDITACTVLPVDQNGMPLCFDPRFASNPHAYIKMWKHHGAEPYMERIRSEAARLGESFPERTGTGITAAFLIPKILETVTEAPEVYAAAHRFMNAGDFLVRCLTGRTIHSSAFASIKEGWSPKDGFPSESYLSALHPSLGNLFTEKIGTSVDTAGTFAGKICPEWAEKTGLSEETAVAVPVVDAHAAFPLTGIGDGIGLMAIGTSGCFCLHSSSHKPIPGIMSCGDDAVAPGMMTYDAGLCCVGDLFDWFVKNGVPSSYAEEAKAKDLSVHKLLREKAQKQTPGQHGLMALGWWNGNRCTLADDNLSGLLIGMRLSTKAEDIYRALIEATAYGMRCILENYTDHGIAVDRIYATGGIALKDPMLMQIYADVMNREFSVLASAQSTAMGSAIYGTVASGRYADIFAASEHFPAEILKTYTPIPENVAKYEVLFREYRELRDTFGKENDIMKRLKNYR